MTFFKAAMKGAVLFFLIMATFNCSCVGDEQEQSDLISSVDIFYIEENSLHLTWNLLKPSGAVRGYSLTWNDGATDKQAQVSSAEAMIEYPSNLKCYDEFTMTVSPLDDENIPIGTKDTKSFVWQDVVIDVIVIPEENMIFASWSIECPSQEVTDIIVIWEEVTHRHELSCHFPGSARNTSAPTKCHTEELTLQPCQNYFVYIEPLDSSSSYIGIAGRKTSYALEEDSGSKLVEMVELTETDSRSVTLLWKGPNPECPDNNYAVKFSETSLEDGHTREGQAKVVKWSKWSNQNKDLSITANLHPSDSGKVMAHVDNLQPFSEYKFCIAAGYGLTNLMCRTFQTLEEKPDIPVGLTLTTAKKSTNSIEVTWKKPSNMNGNFANYIIRWYLDSKFIGSHNTTKHSYKIVNAQPCLNYTIAVTAVNGAGEGEASQSAGTLDNGCLETDNRPSCSTKSEEMLVKSDELRLDITTLIIILGCLGVIVFILIVLVIKGPFLARTGLHSKKSGPDNAPVGDSRATEPLKTNGEFWTGNIIVRDDKDDEPSNYFGQLFAVNEP